MSVTNADLQAIYTTYAQNTKFDKTVPDSLIKGNFPNITVSEWNAIMGVLNNMYDSETTFASSVSNALQELNSDIIDLAANKVDKTTTINGYPLSSNVTILGNVANTSDSDTPVEGGTTKFTTGGAYTELNKKANKVSGAMNGNFAGLDSAGNLTDSGNKASDFEPADSAIMKTDEAQTMTAPLILAADPTTAKEAATKGYVDTKVSYAISGVYTPAGSYTWAEFQQEVSATESYLGHVYTITDGFTTTSDFLEGAGISCPAGTNVIVVSPAENTYMFDALSGFVDLTNYYTGAQCNEKYEPKDAAIMKTDEAQTMTAALKVQTPSADTDAAPKKYVDDAVVGKIDKLTGKTGYIPIFDSNGNIISSDLKLNDPTAHHYTVRWDMKNPQMERLNDAADITTDTSKFLKYEGTSVVSYNNPFDNIYPWSGRKLCNVSINAYRALTRGQSLTQCISYYENETGFSWNASSGVWVYTPEFWGKSWIEGGYQYFDITDKKCYGYTHYPERIEGRWHGSKVSGSLWSITGDTLLPMSNSIPVGNISHKAMVKLARNYGATVDTIESLDANIMLYLVEFAHMNCQVKIGYGVTNSVYLEAKANTYLAYNYSQGVYESNNGGGNTLKVRAGYEDYFIPGAVIDIPWAGDQRQFRRIVSATSPGIDGSEQWFTVTLDQSTGRNVWYDTGIAIRGMANVSDENIGSKSGYIGTNGKCIAYYRGQELWGNRFSIVLGCSNQYGKISYDKAGITYPEPVSDGYIANTGLDKCRVNAALGTTAVESTEDYDTNSFVSDYYWVNPDPTKKTILLQGGSCTQYAGPNGLFCQSWDRDFDFVSPAHNSARPCLINPNISDGSMSVEDSTDFLMLEPETSVPAATSSKIYRHTFRMVDPINGYMAPATFFSHRATPYTTSELGVMLDEQYVYLNVHNSVTKTNTTSFTDFMYGSEGKLYARFGKLGSDSNWNNRVISTLQNYTIVEMTE